MSTNTVHVDTADYLALAVPPVRLRERLEIAVTEHSFLPCADDLPSDWVATIATPAFKLIRRNEGPKAAFCSIGTGTGLDALAAIEALEAVRVGITDVHEIVVETAAENILRNLRNPHSVRLEIGYGDLLAPLADGNSRPRYDLIYENLPNVPVADAGALANERTSSGHVPPRVEPVPELFKRNLLALHYVALLQAKDFLSPGGSVLSMLGARIPLGVYYEMALQAGYRPQIYTYGWKVQVEPESMIGGHLAQERSGYGPYHFYPASILARTFEGLKLEDSGARAFEIEQSLAPHRLAPEAALAAHRRGELIAHTAIALRSTPL